MKTLRLFLACAAISAFHFPPASVFAQGTAFTYQGVLSQGGAAVNGSNDLTFTLYNAVSGGGTVGTSNLVNDLVMSNGLFTVTLDFGAGAFDGSARWLQIAARPGASTGGYTNLAPRTPITATPYAIHAGGATAAGLVGALPASALAGVNGGGLINLNATNLAGTISVARLSTNVALRVGGNAFSGDQVFLGGSIGLGTANPVTTLDVRSDTPAITVGTTFDTSGALFFGNPGHGVKRAYSGGNDVGLYTTAADVYLSANGTTTSQFVLKNSGKVGIGTSSPATKLTVNESTYGIEHTDGTRRLATYVDASGCYFGTISTDPLLFFVNDGAASMMVSTNGNVGIGTDSPSERLHVDGNVLASGKVGIGTSTPKHKLDVAGNIFLGTAFNGQDFTELGDTLYLGASRKYLSSTLGAPINGSPDWINLMCHPLSQGILFGTAGPSDADPHSAPNPLMVIQSGGNVGIGTSAPATKLDVAGTVTATRFVGDGSDLTTIAASNLTGILPDSSLSANVARRDVANIFSGDQQINSGSIYVPNGQISVGGALLVGGNVGIGTSSPATRLQVAGTVTATGFSGNGSGLSGIAAGSVTGTFGAAQIPNLDAAKIASGTMADARLSANVALRSGGNTFNGQQIITGGNLGIRASNPMGSIGYPGGWEGLHVQSPTGSGLAIIQGLNTARLHLRADNNATNVAQDFIMANGANRVDFQWLGGGLGGRLIAMTITTNGSVGIGTTTPSSKLDVAGEVTATAVNITSDRNAKEQFKPVNVREVLDKVVALPITEWQYKTQSDARHIGPMAQDFRAAFGVGRDEKHITSVDADGVALAAIQGLNEVVREQHESIEKLEARNRDLEMRLAGRLAVLEKLMEQSQRQERP